MKKVSPFALGALILWLSSSYWAANWIDKRAFDDFPEKNELAVARLLWRSSPAVNRTSDANRALKFSWLRASIEINRKEKKEMPKIIGVLSEEFSFVAKYIEQNNQSLSSEIKAAAAIQLLTYLNRINLFQNYFDPALDAKLTEISQMTGLLNPTNQENWYREMMIRGQLNGEANIYRENRSNLLHVLTRHGGDSPSIFIEGAIDFYDGILLCVTKNPSEALPYLESAERKLANYPKYTTSLFNKDLNVLLLGKGMEAGPSCDSSISKVISSGA